MGFFFSFQADCTTSGSSVPASPCAQVQKPANGRGADLVYTEQESLPAADPAHGEQCFVSSQLPSQAKSLVMGALQ